MVEDERIPLEREYFNGMECEHCGWSAASHEARTSHCILHKLIELLDIEKRKRPGAFMPSNIEILERL